MLQILETDFTHVSIQTHVFFFTSFLKQDQVPCDSMPSVSITIGGTVFPLSPDTFNLGTYPSGSNQCACAISSTGSLGSTCVAESERSILTRNTR